MKFLLLNSIYFQQVSTNENIHIQCDRKFHELSEYTIIFEKIRYYGNHILKIRTPTYFFQKYLEKYLKKIDYFHIYSYPEFLLRYGFMLLKMFAYSISAKL